MTGASAWSYHKGGFFSKAFTTIIGIPSVSPNPAACGGGGWQHFITPKMRKVFFVFFSSKNCHSEKKHHRLVLQGRVVLRRTVSYTHTRSSPHTVRSRKSNSYQKKEKKNEKNKIKTTKYQASTYTRDTRRRRRRAAAAAGGGGSDGAATRGRSPRTSIESARLNRNLT